jgi:Rieske Fe-S protein
MTCPTSGTLVSLPFSQYPQLMTVGGSASVNANGYSDPVCGQSGIIVVYESPGKYVALSSSCTHACCQVSFTGTEFHCPCHGATFDLTGQPMNGRASQPLPSLTVCSDATGVHVTM